MVVLIHIYIYDRPNYFLAQELDRGTDEAARRKFGEFRELWGALGEFRGNLGKFGEVVGGTGNRHSIYVA